MDTRRAFTVAQATEHVHGFQLVEVNGTTTAGEQVFLTKNEVAHAQEHSGERVLFILHDIEAEELTVGEPRASGGVEKVIWPWVPADEDLLAISFRYTACRPEIGRSAR